MNTYLVAYRKDKLGPAWLLSEAADVEDMGGKNIILCPLSKTAMRTVVYFEAPDIEAARRVHKWLMDGTPKIIPRDPRSARPVCTWEEIQSRLPQERPHVQTAAKDQPRPQALRLLRADPGRGAG